MKVKTLINYLQNNLPEKAKDATICICLDDSSYFGEVCHIDYDEELNIVYLWDIIENK